MFQAKCTGCEFPIEPGDKYLEAMGGTYHVECFNCSVCLYLILTKDYKLFLLVMSSEFRWSSICSEE